MLHRNAGSSSADPGLSADLNRKFNQMFRKQYPIEYSAYIVRKRSHAYRWASTWGNFWIIED